MNWFSLKIIIAAVSATAITINYLENTICQESIYVLPHHFSQKSVKHVLLLSHFKDEETEIYRV